MLKESGNPPSYLALREPSQEYAESARSAPGVLELEPHHSLPGESGLADQVWRTSSRQQLHRHLPLPAVGVP